MLTRDNTVPRDYDDMLSYYTRNGFRVIAIAGKSVEGMTWLKAQRLKRSVRDVNFCSTFAESKRNSPCREQAESGLQFLGFIVFENKLKEATAPAIHALRAAHLAVRMCTGDNVRTAISVARECGLVSHSANVYIPSFASGKHLVSLDSARVVLIYQARHQAVRASRVQRWNGPVSTMKSSSWIRTP